MKKQKTIIPKEHYEYSCLDGYEKAQALAPYLGKVVRSKFMVDKNTPEYLIGLKANEGIEGYGRYWVGKIRFWCNEYLEEKWIHVNSIEIINK
jgi:hypothetical protein